MTIPYAIAEAIREKKARYCRYLDTKRWDALIGLGLPDATLTFHDVDGDILTIGGVRYVFDSPAAFAGTMSVVFRRARTSHQVTNSELSRLSDTEIAALWAMTDYIEYPAIAGIFPVRILGHGHYHEVWQERDGDWLLKELVLKRTSLTIPGLAGMLVRRHRPSRRRPPG
jgi:hypothetical protein